MYGNYFFILLSAIFAVKSDNASNFRKLSTTKVHSNFTDFTAACLVSTAPTSSVDCSERGVYPGYQCCFKTSGTSKICTYFNDTIANELSKAQPNVYKCPWNYTDPSVLAQEARKKCIATVPLSNKDCFDNKAVGHYCCRYRYSQPKSDTCQFYTFEQARAIDDLLNKKNLDANANENYKKFYSEMESSIKSSGYTDVNQICSSNLIKLLGIMTLAILLVMF
jgi:hypothetical protein